MSSESAPIPPARFAAALADLPLGSLYAKRAEIQNSIAHLEISNDQLKEYADEGDADCKDAIEENREVITRMQERMQLLKVEVENRGYRWDEEAKLPNGNQGESAEGIAGEEEQHENTEQAASERPTTQAPSRGQGGSLTDEELQRRLAQQLDEDDDGVHL